MATLAPDQGSTLFNPAIGQLLMQAIGGTVDLNKTGVDTTTGKQSTTGSQNASSTGNTSQNTSGTNSTTGNQATTGKTQNVIDQSTQNLADVTALQKVFAQQQSGITPEMLAAIFSEGAKAAPGLVTATANAVGARSVDNSPLATALTQLSGNLTNQAARLSLEQRNASAQTAAQIAQATGGTRTTGNNMQTSQQDTTNQQLVSILQNVLGNQQNTSQQTNNQVQDTNQQVSSNSNTQQDTQPNYGNVTKLLGMLLGASTLNKGLSDVGGISGAVQTGTGGIADIIRSIVGGSSIGGGGVGNGSSIVGSDGAAVPGTYTDGLGLGGTAPGETTDRDPLRALEQLLASNPAGLQSGYENLLQQLAVLEANAPPQADDGGAVTFPVDNQNWYDDEGWAQLDIAGGNWGNWSP